MINQHSMISYFKSKPKTIFIIDSIGAFLSSFCLFIISRFYSNYIGIDSSKLILLTILPNIYCIYSACCYLLVKQKFKLFIRVIAIANLLYCLITMFIIGFHYDHLTILGFTYFILEIFIIAFLVNVEFKISNILNQSA